LLPVDRNLRRIHVQHQALRRINRFSSCNQLPVDRGQPAEVLFLRQQLRLERLHPGGQRRSSLPDSFRTHEPEGRILRQTLSIVHVFVSSQSAVHSLTQQIGHWQLRVLPS